MPATAPAIRIIRPAGAAGRSAFPVTTSHTPTARNTSVMTHRSVAPDAASALTVSATGLKDGGWSPAATVHPPIKNTGDATDDTTPHQGGRRRRAGGSLATPRARSS